MLTFFVSFILFIRFSTLPLRNQLVRMFITLFIHSSIPISLPIRFSIALRHGESSSQHTHTHTTVLHSQWVQHFEYSFAPFDSAMCAETVRISFPAYNVRVCLHLIRYWAPIIRLLATLATLTHNALLLSYRNAHSQSLQCAKMHTQTDRAALVIPAIRLFSNNLFDVFTFVFYVFSQIGIFIA